MVATAFRTRQYCSALLFALLVGVCLPARLGSQESATRESPNNDGVLRPARSDVTGEQIFADLIRHNELRSAALRSYSAVRSYAVTDPKGKMHAQKTVRLDYRAPDSKSFVTISEKGSAVVRHLVLNRLMESETETAAGKSRRDSSISPANYTFSLLGEEDLGTRHCFVVQATPTRTDKYLFDGKVWIDAQDFAVVQIVGHPAKKLSIWVDQADFVRRYQKIGNFWLPLRDETSVHVRFYGRKILTIEHGSYTINDAHAEQVPGGGENTRR
jgi:hypothetical protein